MTVGVAQADTVVDVGDCQRVVRGVGNAFGLVASDAEIDVDAAASVGQAHLWLPQFEVEPAGRQSGALAVVTSVDDLEPEVGVKRERTGHLFDLQNDFEQAGDAGFDVVALAELDAVAVGVVKIQRAGVPERLFDEIEPFVESVVPVVVLPARNRHRVVGVQAAAGNGSRLTKYEIGIAGSKRHLPIAFDTNREVEKRLVERLCAVEIFHFEREMTTTCEHANGFGGHGLIGLAPPAVALRRGTPRWVGTFPHRGHKRGMPMKGSGAAADWTEIDRFEDERTAGVGWIAHPDETMERASHALAVDGDVWVIDPVDVEGLDELLGEIGSVAGVVVLLDRHKRDAAAVATRHGVSVHLPEFMRDIADDFDAPVELVHGELGETDYVPFEVVDNIAWSEAALYSEDDGVLVVPESVGTSEYFLAAGERLGVHPAVRLFPPKDLARLAPERVLVGHGSGVHDDATATLEDAISGSRTRTPGLYLKSLKMFLS